MKFKILLLALTGLLLVSCHSHSEHDEHEENGDNVKIQLTAYTKEYELFAEADPFVAGRTSNLLSHFSGLPDFKALEKGRITARLIVEGQEVIQTLDKPTRKGIYSFELKPELAGTGQIIFDIINGEDSAQVSVPGIMIYSTKEEADDAAEKLVISRTNTTVFTKEQSWKIDFSTGIPVKGPFGQVIKTTAQVQSALGDEIIVSAKSSGIITFSSNNILEGKLVSKDQLLFTISGSEFADNNTSVQYAKASSDFEKAKSDYNRAKGLAKDKIVSEKALFEAKNRFENAKVIFDNLNKNFSSSGQKTASPMRGFIKQLFVQNSSYIESGQVVVTISQNKKLVLNAEVQQKYASVLGTINSANIRTLHDNKTYSLEDLNGQILSYGKAANSDNYLLPVKLQIDNTGNFISGGFVEVYLKMLSSNRALTVPNPALLEEQGNFFVFVQITPELFEKREVKTGVTDGLRTEILEGITDRERIVSKGSLQIKLAQATGTLDAHSGHVH